MLDGTCIILKKSKFKQDKGQANIWLQTSLIKKVNILHSLLEVYVCMSLASCYQWIMTSFDACFFYVCLHLIGIRSFFFPLDLPLRGNFFPKHGKKKYML